MGGVLPGDRGQRAFKERGVREVGAGQQAGWVGPRAAQGVTARVKAGKAAAGDMAHQHEQFGGAWGGRGGAAAGTHPQQKGGNKQNTARAAQNAWLAGSHGELGELPS